ncbi:MAG: DUF2804 domain-containing protein [Actinomycetota bacterium]|nr:DUF2804 domain-containing protein [Actinomycetota bacterium]
MKQQREMKKTPERMTTDGRVTEFGAFDSPFREVNPLDIEFKFMNMTIPRFLKNLRLKEWQHFGFVCDDYYFGMIIFDVKFMSHSFFYFYDRNSGDLVEHNRFLVSGPVKVADQLWNGKCFFRHFGYRLEFENKLESNYHRVIADISGHGSKPGIKAELKMIEDLESFEPLIVVNPIGSKRMLYTHKAVCPAEGEVRIGNRTVVLNCESDICMMDVQKTYYPYKSFWYWATFGGYDSSGRLIGVNLCEGVSSDQDRFNENCLWVDGKIKLLSAAKFTFDKGDVLRPWNLGTKDNMVDLEFKPLGERKSKITLGFVMSDFHQPFGYFSGKMKGKDDEGIEVAQKFGVCEHHLFKM